MMIEEEAIQRVSSTPHGVKNSFTLFFFFPPQRTPTSSHETTTQHHSYQVRALQDGTMGTTRFRGWLDRHSPQSVRSLCLFLSLSFVPSLLRHPAFSGLNRKSPST